MKILKQLSATILLALVLSASAYAGDMSGPTGAPAPGDMPGPTRSLAPGEIGGPSTATVPGDVSIPGLTAIMNVLGFLAGY